MSISPSASTKRLLDNPSLSSSTLKPYLQLPHLLSLTWLAYPILSLLFVAFRLQLSLASSENDVASARSDLVASCAAAEHAATAAASLPRYLASATNKQFADAINDSMNGARAALILALTIMETVINFIVDIYRSTFLCFVELIIQGGLALLIDAVKEISSFVTSTGNALASSIQSDVASTNSAIQTLVDGINKVNPFSKITAPQFTIPSLTSLQNITLPTDFEDALVKLNSSLPTFTEIKQTIDNFLDTPFELLKADINSTFSNLTFDVAVLPVPEQQTLSFCGNLDTSIVDDLGRDLAKAAQIGTVILVALALLLVGANCALEWYKWRCTRRHLENTRLAWMGDNSVYQGGTLKGGAPQMVMSDHNLLMLQANGAHPMLTRMANAVAAKLRMSPSQHTHLRWFLHYIFHPPALACFLIGFFGLLSVQIQLVALGPIEAKFDTAAQASVANFNSLIVTSINNSMFNQSSLYANDINSRVDTIQNTINDGVFGWVNITTTSLNNSLNNFYTDVQTVVADVFNGTILENPAQDFIKCILGSKVDAIEEALTFLHNNLNINMPRVNESILVLNNGQVDEVTQPIAQAAIGSPGTNGSSGQGVVGKLIATYLNDLKKERMMFGIFMGLWGIVVIMGLAVVFWHSYGRGWWMEYKRRKFQREKEEGLGTVVVPFRDPSINEKGLGMQEAPAFTPMASPDEPVAFDYFKPKTPSGTADSFYGAPSEAAAPSSASRTHRPSMSLVSGRRVNSQEVLGYDTEQPNQERPRGFLARFKGLLHKNDDDEVKAGPVYRISITPASESVPELVEQRLSSTWSVSPVAPPKNSPWSVLVPSRKIPPPPSHPPIGLPIRPNMWHHASVPSDVQSTDTDSVHKTLRVTNPSPTPLVLPLHHGFTSPPSPPPPQSPITHTQWATLSPPPDNRNRPRSSPSSPNWPTQPSPTTRLLTRTHARQSSGVNPFATPFDDEHQVKPNMNPFADENGYGGHMAI